MRSGLEDLVRCAGFSLMSAPAPFGLWAHKLLEMEEARSRTAKKNLMGIFATTVTSPNSWHFDALISGFPRCCYGAGDGEEWWAPIWAESPLAE